MGKRKVKARVVKGNERLAEEGEERGNKRVG